ncbi:helix-turn-helix transcriptional regulator [Archangium primigenium]|uniref:helix-turn-helix transcriptional regulator n=1 Tax=[Archangium] primigenium TaxID=2792470 RepID=UPI0019570429|nr:AraC family transcriptional regulator [Archangium primigenium]MBM7118047.1 helix-turn-helix transcriptional regulator [Archangium primigenium]
MPRPSRKPRHRILTLAALGARELPLHVSHIASRTLLSSYEPVVATFALFFLVTGGTGQGRHLEQVDARPGELHFIPAGVEIHALDVAELEGWLVAFDPTLLGSLEPEAPGSGAGSAAGLARSLGARWSFRLLLGEARRQRLELLIAALDTELRDQQFGFERAARALFTLLMTELQREARVHPAGPLPSPGRLVRDVLAFVATHSLKPISLADVAAAVGRTASYVATAVRDETGLTVGDWLREHRMAEARRRLLETTLSVESIASQVGYSDVTAFVRGFRRAHGLTPRVWRERHRQAGD